MFINQNENCEHRFILIQDTYPNDFSVSTTSVLQHNFNRFTYLPSFLNIVQHALLST